MKQIVFLLLLSMSAICSGNDEFWIDMEQAEPGQLVRTEWAGLPIAVLYRTDEMIERLRVVYGAQNEEDTKIFRSIKPEYFVFIDRYGDSGPRPAYTRSDSAVRLYDAQAGLVFDASGRSSGTAKLKVPQYHFVSDTKMVFSDE